MPGTTMKLGLVVLTVLGIGGALFGILAHAAAPSTSISHYGFVVAVSAMALMFALAMFSLVRSGQFPPHS